MRYSCNIYGIHTIPAILLGFLLFLSTGCDSHQEQASDKKGSLEHEGRQLTILVTWTHVGATDKLAKMFFEETGAVVRIIKVEYHDLLSATVKDFNSSAPQADIYMIWYAHTGRLAEEGVIVPLDSFYARYAKILDVPDFIPYFFDAYTLYRNKRWTVPYDGDIQVLFYRKSLLSKHGLTPPSTWQEYLKVSRYITENERENSIYGAALMAYPTSILIVSSFLNRLGGFGGTLIAANQDPQIDTPEAVAALKAMVEHASYALPSPLETDFAVARDAFIQGKVGMVEQWTDIGIMAEDPRQSLIRGDWGVVPIPLADGVKGTGVAPLNGGWALALSAKSSSRDLAEKFLAFSARRDVTLQLNTIPGSGGLDPIRKSTVSSPEFKAFAPQVSKVKAQLLDSHSIAFPNHPAVPELLDDLTNAIVAALEHRLSPSAALKACQENWNERLKSRH